LNEQARINALIEHVLGQGFDGTYEIIFVDGDPHGGTIKVVQDSDVVCMISARGRGRQMNVGAARASGDILLFLHADTMLPADGLKKIGASDTSICLGTAKVNELMQFCTIGGH